MRLVSMMTLTLLQVLSSLAHPRIICLLGACLVPPHICIVEELAEGGSLYARLHARGAHQRGSPLTYAEVWRAIRYFKAVYYAISMLSSRDSLRAH